MPTTRRRWRLRLVPGPNGNIIVCIRGGRPTRDLPMCAECQRHPGYYQCDYQMQGREGTCDRYLCGDPRCTETRLTGDGRRDYCRSHFPPVPTPPAEEPPQHAT